MQAYVHGVSTRKVDDLVNALGVDTGISKSEVCRICANLDREVRASVARLPPAARCSPAPRPSRSSTASLPTGMGRLSRNTWSLPNRAVNSRSINAAAV
jgi:hypothetical protein